MPNKIDAMNQAKLAKKANAATIRQAAFQKSMAKKSENMFSKQPQRSSDSPLLKAMERNTQALERVGDNTESTATVISKDSKNAISGEAKKKEMKRLMAIEKEERAYRKSMLGFFDKLSKKFGQETVREANAKSGPKKGIFGVKQIGDAVDKAKSGILAKLMKIGLFGTLIAGVITGDYSRFIKLFAIAADPLRNLKAMGRNILGFFDNLALLPLRIKKTMSFLKNPAAFMKRLNLDSLPLIGKFLTNATTKIGDIFSAIGDSKFFGFIKKGAKWIDEALGLGPKLSKIGKPIMGLFETIGKFGHAVVKSFKGLGALAKGGGAVAKVAKVAGKGLKFLSSVPGLGLIISIPLAIMAFKKGDVVGGFLELASGLTSLIPVAGPFISMGIEAYLLFRSFKGADYKEKEKKVAGKIADRTLFGIPGIGTIYGIVKAVKAFKGGDKAEGFKMLGKSLAALLPGGAMLFELGYWAVTKGIALFKDIKSSPEKQQQAKAIGLQVIRNMPGIGTIIQIKDAIGLWKSGDKAGALKGFGRAIATVIPGGGFLFDAIGKFVDKQKDKISEMPAEKKAKLASVSMDVVKNMPGIGVIIQMKEAFDLFKAGDKLGALKGIARGLATIVPGGGLLFDKIAGMADWAAKAGQAKDFLTEKGAAAGAALQAGGAKAKELAMSVFGKVTDFRNSIRDKGIGFINNVKDSEFGQKAQAVAGKIFGALSSFKDNVMQKGMAVLNKISDNPLFKKATEIFKKIFDPILNIVNAMFSGISKVISQVSNGLSAIASDPIIKGIAEKFFGLKLENMPAPTAGSVMPSPVNTRSNQTAVLESSSGRDEIGDPVGFGEFAGLATAIGSFSESIVPAPSTDGEGLGATSATGMSAEAAEVYDTKDIKVDGWFSHKPRDIKASHDIKDRNNKFPQGLIPYKNTINVRGVNKDVWHNFQGMVAEYHEKTGDGVQLNSAYRSLAEQEQLFKTKPPGYAARPGRSLHNWGFALDINSADANAMADTPSDIEQGKSIMDRWGFYRPIKSKEPWHIQPKSIDRFEFADIGEQKFNNGYTAPEMGDPVDMGSASQIGDPVQNVRANLPRQSMGNIRAEGQMVVALAEETIMRLLEGQNKIARDNKMQLNTTGPTINVNGRG
jgi:hypothetical protein